MTEDGLVERIAALPRRVALTYLTAASTWIVVSDLALASAVDPARQPIFDIGKGLLFVVVTTAALYLVLKRLTTQVVRAVRSRAQTSRRFQALIERADELIVIVDADENVTYVSPSFRRVLGFDPEQLVGRQIADMLHPDDVAALRSRPTRFSGTPTAVRVRHAEEGWRYFEALESNHFDDPAIAGVVINARDISPQLEAEQQLAWALSHDVVTGLPSRVEFETKLLAATETLADDRCIAVVLGDLDGFRRVNAMTARQGGDAVLREVAQRLRSAADDCTVLGRIGSDRFAFAKPVEDDEQVDARLTTLMEELRHRVRQPVPVRGIDLRLSMACGAAILRAGGSPQMAIVDAEAALREAKGHLDRTAIAASGSGARASRTVGDLDAALRGGQMLLHFQPQLDLRTRRLVGVEGLLRWAHPVRGVLSAGEFLDALRAEDLMPEVTRLALREGAMAARRLHDAGSDTRVSINLSLKDLSRRHLLEEAVGVLHETGADASWLRLELTEQALLIQPDVSLQTMHDLRDLGFSFAIDDFGTGYSSLAHLRLLPVQELKIDRSFTAAVDEPVNRAIVATICRLGAELGLVTVAEGVADEGAIDRLIDLGCELGQSYHLGRPVHLDQLDVLQTDAS